MLAFPIGAAHNRRVLDVIARSALEQAAFLARGEVSVEQLTRAYLTRIERLDPALSAFAQFAPEQALATARRLDRAQRRRPKGGRGPLWGLPTGMKDLHLTRGLFTRLGSRAYRYFWSPIDDVTSAAVRSAGLVILGKLTTSELALMPVVDTELQPPTRNPYDTSRYSGGSSGGTGAAIAAGMLPIAVAIDGAGSIRIPAAFCGLVGHKPSRGLLPNPLAPFDRMDIGVVGPIARCVDDAAALIDVLGGRPPEGGTFQTRVARPPAGLRVRFTCDSPVTPTEPALLAAVHRVAHALEDLGHKVEEGPRLEGDLDEFLPVFSYAAQAVWIVSERSLQDTTRWLRERGRRVPFEVARAARDALQHRVERWFDGVDLWVTPTVATAAPAIGAFKGRDGEASFRAAAALGAFTAGMNVSGTPATSIPLFGGPKELPVGVQLIAPLGHDARTLSVARALLESLGTPLAPFAPLAQPQRGDILRAQGGPAATS